MINIQEPFRLTNEEITRINDLVNDMESEPKCVCETGCLIRKLEIRGQLMEVYVQIGVPDDDDDEDEDDEEDFSDF